MDKGNTKRQSRNEITAVLKLLQGQAVALNRIEKKLNKIDTQSSLNKDYLTTREACAYLGCGRTMLWKYVNEGKINRLKKENGRTYYAAQELKNIIENPAVNVEVV